MENKKDLHPLEIPELVGIINEHIEFNINKYQQKGWKDNVEMTQVVQAMINGGYIDSWEDRYSVYKPIENSEGESQLLFNLGKKNYELIQKHLEIFGKLTNMFCHIRLELNKNKLIARIITIRTTHKDI